MYILLVDDEKNSRESVAEFLEELGHQVQQSDNAGTATRLFKGAYLLSGHYRY